MYKVLLVDDEIEIIRGRSKIVEDLGFKCITALNGKNAIKLVKNKRPDIVLTDIKMPNNDGFDVLKATRKFDPDIPVILFTGYGSIDSAVQAMKLGAYDYIQKPVSVEILEVVLKKAVDFLQLKKENLVLKSQIQENCQLDNMIANSKIMQDIAKRIKKIAQSDANVFVYGESGTGKELVAQNIHSHSRRCDKPLIPVDCVALPGTLMESELFGYEKGAFTGAVGSKPGLMELANGGSLFLDEITELDINLQAKLLRVLQEQKFRRVGGTKTIHVDVRIISATNIVPLKAVKDGKLRQDLYFRLNVVPIELPPLRERKDDISLLVQHFIEKYNPSTPREIIGISKEAVKCLKSYDWPGNVRELQNVVEQTMLLTENDVISPEDLPDHIKENGMYEIELPTETMKFQEAREKYLNEFCKKYVENMLTKCNGNISMVARQSGMSRWTIYRMMKTVGIEQKSL